MTIYDGNVRSLTIPTYVCMGQKNKDTNSEDLYTERNVCTDHMYIKPSVYVTSFLVFNQFRCVKISC
jgi:hypothetical protein